MSRLLWVVLDKQLRGPHGAGAPLQVGIYASWGVLGGEELAQSWQVSWNPAFLLHSRAQIWCECMAGSWTQKFRPFSVEGSQDSQVEP